MQGLILVIFSSYNLEVETKYTPIKLADDTEAAAELGCHSEALRQAGGTGWQESHDTQQGQSLNPAPGIEWLPATAQARDQAARLLVGGSYEQV